MARFVASVPALAACSGAYPERQPAGRPSIRTPVEQWLTEVTVTRVLTDGQVSPLTPTVCNGSGRPRDRPVGSAPATMFESEDAV